MQMYVRKSAAFVALFGPFAPSMAQASGQLPPMTIEDRKMPSFAACQALLDTILRKDLKRADPKPIPVDDGDRRTLINTNGVVATDRRHADYEVEEGWQVRRAIPETRQIRTDYNYARRHYTCNGRRLTGTSVRGYMLEGYAPMTVAEIAQ
jgi:hypothetical protein